MTDPISSAQSKRDPIEWSFHAYAKEDAHGADAQVASLYYQSTISSLAPQDQTVQASLLKVESAKTEKSIFSRAKDWLWGIFGWGQQQPVSDLDDDDDDGDPIEEDPEDPFSGGPKLSEPEFDQKRRLSQAISELNRDLVNRLKDIAEFEEEMRKSGSNKLDKLLFMNLVESSLKQKQLSQSRSLLAQEDLFELHKKNKELHKLHFGLMDTIDSENRTRGILKWVNVGLTAMTVGGMAIAFASGGSAVAIGLPIALLGKGGSMIFDGILKYKTDVKTGELGVLKQETKMNASNEREHLTEMQAMDGEVASLLKKIRHILDNQTKAERASFGNK
jgi:hypothetical protein